MSSTKKIPSYKFIYAITLIGAVMISLRLPIKEDYFEMSKQLEILNSAFRELNIFYVDPLSPGDLMHTGIDAMLESLDPYTRYYPESRIEDVRFMSTGEYGGVGIALGEQWDGSFSIIDVKENSPADRMGLHLGDNLIEIDGQTISTLDMKQIGELIKGASGTIVKLGILRPVSSNTETISITREKIKQLDVPYFGMLDESTGYLILSKFTRTASVEVRKALLQLTDSMGATKIVFDLRGNGGGLLREAVNIVNLFVPKGEDVVSMRGKTPEWNKTYQTVRKAILPNIPLAILMDDHSASASEIVAGTLQDLDRAVIIGSESFGKGLVQQTKKLAYGTRMKITVAKYYTASGRCVQRLHYGQRDETGEATIQADSSLQMYFTRNGRPVIEGRGVIPDIELEPEELSYLTSAIQNSGVIFDFAVKETRENNIKFDPENLTISDDLWNDFIDFTITSFENTEREFPYKPRTSFALEVLEKALEEDGKVEEGSEIFSSLKEISKPHLRDDLLLNETEVRQALEEEIVFHTSNKSGLFKYLLPKDKVAIEATSILESGEYLDILSGIK